MIRFVNAKLNLGLNIVRKREDGYHDLETIFYPIGLYNGTPENPEPFCDMLEITPSEQTEFIFSGRSVDCPLEKNLVYKAWKVFNDKAPDMATYRITLEKHLPDGAGLGGGSADAAFVLLMLNDLEGNPFDDAELADMALKLGADCPFFIYNNPCFAEGVGEKIMPIELDLAGMWVLLVKPEVSISTKEAFAGVKPMCSENDLREVVKLEVGKWNGLMKNDFEDSLFPGHPVLKNIKERMKAMGADYTAMSGSGSTIFGIFRERAEALKAMEEFNTHYTTVCKL